MMSTLTPEPEPRPAWYSNMQTNFYNGVHAMQDKVRTGLKDSNTRLWAAFAVVVLVVFIFVCYRRRTLPPGSEKKEPLNNGGTKNAKDTTNVDANEDVKDTSNDTVPGPKDNKDVIESPPEKYDLYKKITAGYVLNSKQKSATINTILVNKKFSTLKKAARFCKKNGGHIIEYDADEDTYLIIKNTAIDEQRSMSTRWPPLGANTAVLQPSTNPEDFVTFISEPDAAAYAVYLPGSKLYPNMKSILRT